MPPKRRKRSSSIRLPDVTNDSKHIDMFRPAGKDAKEDLEGSRGRTHSDNPRAKRQEYYLANKDNIGKQHKLYYSTHSNEAKESMKRYYLRLREHCLDHYGATCEVCHESNEGFLTLDHIGHDGAKHRREIGSNLYLWAFRNGFPTDLQTLCYNCQWVKELDRRGRGAYSKRHLELPNPKMSTKKGFCTKCRVALTPETSRPSVFANGYGLCRSCQSQEDAGRDKDVKRAVIEHFGGKCVCCGENRIERLTIGHPNRDGNTHRRELGRGTPFYRELVKRGFQSNFHLRVECWNCNLGSYRNAGVCPHLTRASTHTLKRL